VEAPYLRITPGHYANIGENDTLFKDREPSKTIPYPAARTYIAHIGEYPPRGGLSAEAEDWGW